MIDTNGTVKNQRLDIRKSNCPDFTYQGTLCVDNFGVCDIYFNRLTKLAFGLSLDIADNKTIALLDNIPYGFI